MNELRPRSNRSRVPGIARHGRLKKANPWKAIVGFLAATTAVALVSTVSVGAVAAWQLTSNITDNEIVIVGKTIAPPPSIGAYPGGFNILVVGSDTREGQGGIGGSISGELNDVTMLLHVSADHSSAVAVSFPRDLVVPLPACPNGGPATGLPINTTLSYGGLTCTVLTVEKLTGLEIQFAGVITFNGVIEMSNAIGGVDVCINEPINDPWSGLYLPEAGTHTLSGWDALAFLRSRHGVGDGSDLGRINSQQVYLSSLVRKLKSNDTLSDPLALYGLASAATTNMNLSQSLNKIDTMIAIAQALRKIDLDKVVFTQYPGTTGHTEGIYAGKVAPNKAAATKLFDYIRADQQFVLGETRSIGSVPDPNAPVAEPGDTPVTSDLPVLNNVMGQTAADYTCAKAN